MDLFFQYSVIPIAIILGVIQSKRLMTIDEFPVPQKKIEEYYLRGLPVFLILLAILISAKGVETITGWQYISILLIMGVTAYVDYRMNIIPNEYLVFGIILRGICFVVEILVIGYDAFPQMLADLIGLIIILVLALIIRVLSRKGLGMGDIKLFAIMPLFLGVLPALNAMLYSLIISFFQACYFLITKKKGKNDFIPFGPAIFLGTLAEIWFSII